MFKDFINLVDVLEKKWDAEIVPTYEKLKQYCLNKRVLSKAEAQGAINELHTRYLHFYAHATTSFASCNMGEAERSQAEKFVNDVKENHQADINELINIYNKKAAMLRSYFFQKEALRLPMPTVEEQYTTREIFPSDPETHPQYYTYDFK
ncbi:Uncharacterised protein [Legionella steigerwaltii]|uniref:Uncharacterized protein n=1 Tax=Legionella steigerwaltii TaxID=460 RepID=A0A378LDL7_9GAMM|nr:hypothetical protein [Legionella steigerwaltii]KTD71691.1 hypothetical protein Lstg_2899 [Legionella steigerwaltii]STY23859.1 Uncharacterised protein [Legionella steigerwaltii]